MSENPNYETYIFISKNKLVISIKTKLDEKIFDKELIIKDSSFKLDFEILNAFLNENIFKIEKKIENFINETTIILDLDIFDPIEISVKSTHESIVDLKKINHLLYEARDYCRNTLREKKIIHMLINEYKLDNKSFLILPNDIRCKSFSVDIKFICISKNIIKNLEQILKKYQISLKQVVSFNYIKDFLSDSEKDIFSVTKKIINGHNPNEVKFVDKNAQNIGFFEKFFNFFN